jgi:hypothetical protein
MKYYQHNKTMIIFLCLIISLSFSFKNKNNDLKPKRKKAESLKISSLKWDKNDYDFEILDEMIKKMKTEQDFLKRSFDYYSKIMDSQEKSTEDNSTLANYFKIIKSEFNKAEIMIRELSVYINNVNFQLSNGKKEDKIGFESYKKFSKERKKNGVNLINQLMRQFLFTNETKKTLKKMERLFSKLPDVYPKRTKLSEFVQNFPKIKQEINDKIKKGSAILQNVNVVLKNPKKTIQDGMSKVFNTIKSFKWRKKKFRVESEASQYSRMRIWSSFRIDEIVNNINFDEAQGEDVVRAAIISMMSGIPSHFCWVHDRKLGIPDVVCPNNMKRKGSICYEECEDGQINIGGFCFTSCPDSYIDCNMFCSKSNCENPKDFILKHFKKIQYLINPSCPKGYKKKGHLCYPVCEEIGLHTCSDRTCAINKQTCQNGMPILETGVIKAFVSYLGHIYSIRSGKKFGWTDPEGLERAIEIMGLRYDWNILEMRKILDLASKLAYNEHSKLRKTLEKNIEKIGSSFFKTKDNTPIKLLFKWSDFSKVYGEYINEFISTLLRKKNSNKNNGENWNVCKLTSFSQECLKRFSRLLVISTPYYLVDIIGYISKPICHFELNANIN